MPLYGSYLAEAQYRFNRRFNLASIVARFSQWTFTEQDMITRFGGGMAEKFFFDAGRFEFHLHESHLLNHLLQFDVKPFGVNQHVIEQVVFRAKRLPTGWSMSSDARIGEERWKISWTALNLAAASLMNEPFSTAVRFGLESGWLDQVRKEERELAAYGAAPQKELGNRSPNQIAKIGLGAYEVPGHRICVVRPRGYGDQAAKATLLARAESQHRVPLVSRERRKPGRSEAT
jgi:hypothetical protein